MRQVVLALSLSLVAGTAFSEDRFSLEVLLGNSSNELDNKFSVEDLATSWISKEKNSSSYGLRASYKLNQHFTAEFSYHDYGEAYYKYIGLGSLDSPVTGNEWINTTNTYVPYNENLLRDENADGEPDGEIDINGGGVVTVPFTSENYTAQIDQADISSINMGIKGSLALSENFSLTYRAGLASWTLQKVTTRSTTSSDYLMPSKKSDLDLYYSLGFDYKFHENFFLGLEYSILNMKWTDTSRNNGNSYSSSNKYDIKNASLSFGYLF